MDKYEDLFRVWPYNLASEAWGKCRFLLHCPPAYLEAVFSDIMSDRERKLMERMYAHGARLVDAGVWLGMDEEEAVELHDSVISRIRGYVQTIRETPADETVIVTAEEEDEVLEGNWEELKPEDAEDVDDPVRDVPIEYLDLSVRSYNGLDKAGIRTLGDLADMTEAEVGEIRNLGKKSLREITMKLHEQGLEFRTAK